MLPFPLPFSRFEITSVLPPEQVEARLESRVARNPSLGERASFSIESMFRQLEGQDVPLWLEGKVAGRGFRLHKLIGAGTNSFVPVLTGCIRPSGQGSVISVFARPPWLPLLLVIPWLVGVASVGASTYGTQHFWVPCLLALAAPVIVIVTFVPQLVSVRRALIAFLNAGSQVTGAT